MKKQYILFVLILISIVAYSQDNDEVKLLKQKGDSLYALVQLDFKVLHERNYPNFKYQRPNYKFRYTQTERDSILKSSRAYYVQLITKFPESSLVEFSKFKIAHSFRLTKNYKEAIEYYEQVYNNIASGLSSESLRFDVCMYLSECNLEIGDYSNASFYIEAMESTKHSTSFCANSIAEDYVRLTKLQSLYYWRTGNTKEALKKCLPLLYSDKKGHASSWSRGEVCQIAYKILLEKYTKEELINKIELAFNDIHLDENKNSTTFNLDEYNFILLENIEVRLPPNYQGNELSDYDHFKKIKNKSIALIGSL